MVCICLNTFFLDLPIGSHLLTAHAEDIDDGNVLEYSLLSENAHMFAVERFTGAVVLKGRLDYENTRVHVVRIQVGEILFLTL